MSGGQETRTMQALVRERIGRWREGDEPDAAAALAEHPELRSFKSLVMDLALAEYSLRTAAGDAIGRDEFCDRFPTYRQSIAKMLDVQDFLDKCPDFNSGDGAADEELARWPLLGEEFLGYELVEPLGRGGLARVFLAREVKLGGRLVVVKISRHRSQEAAALGKLSHPSVVPIHSVKHDAAGEWTVICMPLVGVATGIDLLDAAFAAGAKRDGALVERVSVETRPLEAGERREEAGDRGQGVGPARSEVRDQGSEFEDLSYDEAVGRIGVQLAEGLVAAHAAGIMHRDIKPSNILLAWSGRAMLLDFNLAMDASAGSESLGGTLAYMAPEVLGAIVRGQGTGDRGQGDKETRGQGAEHECGVESAELESGGGRSLPTAFDPRGDVYSLGAVLFELLTGRLPATPENAQKLSPVAYRAWLDCKRAKIGVPANVEVDSRLMAVVLKCLAFEAAARFASAEELAAELRRFLERAARPRVMRKVRRRAAIAAGVALVVGGGGAWAYVASRPMTAERLYERGLAEYQRGEYSQAIETFTQCLERRPGWTEALFGRGQALLRLEKWSEARTDFMALRRVNSAWANAFVGYCSLRTGESNLASANFFSAYRDGLRDVAFLLDYAKAETMQQHHSEAAKRYSEVIEREPTNVEAIRNRAMTLFMVVVNDKEKIPTQQAFDDIEKYCRLSPDSFEAPYCGAVVYGEAAKKNSAFENKAIRYLTEALQKGMPLEAVGFYKLQVKRLLPFVSAQVLIDARRDSTYRLDLRPPHEPPSIADWRAFQKQYGLARELLVRNK